MKSLAIALAAAALAATPPLAAQGVAEQEPNDGHLTATPLAAGAQAYGDLTAGDADWFRLVLAQDSDLRCWTAPGFGAQCGNTRLGLFDAQGQLVAEVDDGSPATHGLYSLLEAGRLAPGTWFLRVRGFDPQTAGSYTLDAEVLPAGALVAQSPPVTAVAEAPEPNDPRLPGGMATTGPAWALLSGRIRAPAWSAAFTVPGADYDFYKVHVPEAGLLTLATAAGPAPAAGDTVLHLCDAALTVLAFDDDGGPGFYSLLRYQVPAAGRYFVAVSDYGTGNFELSVDLAPPMPTGAATVAVLGGGCGPIGGVPRLGTRFTSGPALVRVERPVLGTGYWLDLTNAPANRLIARLYNLLPRQFPLSLQPLGAPGCVSEVDDPFVDFTLTDAAGVHFWGVPVPADVGLVGLPLEQQVAVHDPAANALGVRMSNRVSAVVGVGF